jgi:cyclopropane fatty-acyl-phospholipid synthase-like methyltransferase
VVTKKYYEAYDQRYRQIHALQLQWFQEGPTAIVLQTIEELSLSKSHKILEIGCGEGRDAAAVLETGYALRATDISAEAIDYCRRKFPQYSGAFSVLDCIGGHCEEKFDFIYAVAVLHMLVDDGDRRAFYSFLREHLNDDGAALICTMGDGDIVCRTDPATAFDTKERIHTPSGRLVQVASTSCRMVTEENFHAELEGNGLQIKKSGLTSAEPDFPWMLYAVVTKKNAQ